MPIFDRIYGCDSISDKRRKLVGGNYVETLLSRYEFIKSEVDILYLFSLVVYSLCIIFKIDPSSVALFYIIARKNVHEPFTHITILVSAYYQMFVAFLQRVEIRLEPCNVSCFLIQIGILAL